MKRVIVLYGTPDDPTAFDKHYADIHVPLVRAMPHLQGFETSSGDVAVSDEAVTYHLIAILTYANDADLEASLGSDAGQKAVADVANFASGGATIVTVEAKDWL